MANTVAVAQNAIGASASSALSKIQMIFAHCTGLCKETWSPVVKELDRMMISKNVTADVLLFDFTGHGDSAERANVFGDNPTWQNFHISLSSNDDQI